MIPTHDLWALIKKKIARNKKRVTSHMQTKKSTSVQKNKKTTLLPLHENISRDLLDLNAIEYRITSTKVENTENVIFHNKLIPNDYVRIALALPYDGYDIIITIKTFRTGGTDKLLLRYLKGIQQSQPELRIVLLVLEGHHGDWDYLLPDSVDLIYLKNYCYQTYSQQLYNQILERLIVQHHIKILWNFNCRETYIFTEQCADFIRENIEVWGLIFAHWLRPNNLQEFGMAHENLPFVIQDYTKIISDNQTFINYLCNQYGWNTDKFHTLYVPNSDYPIVGKTHAPEEAHLKILWASGMEWNKGVSLLAEIAKLVSHLPISIDVYGGTKNKDGENLLLKLNADIALLKNITYKGRFNNFTQLVSQGGYNCFLFTSIVEGMPNVVIEAAEQQLSIVSPIVGGLGEFLNTDNAYLVADKTSAKEYAEQLEIVLKNKQNNIFSKELALMESYNHKFTLDSFSHSFTSMLLK